MESEHEEALNKLIDGVSFALLIVGIVLIGWFFADWILIGNAIKPFFDILDLNSVARIIVGIVCIIGFLFGQMFEKKKIESIPSHGKTLRA